MNETYIKIKKDFQIKKFCMYGFLKDLRFFEPYLVIYLLSMELRLFHIGILFSIREAITYVFEVPSGIFADNYGKKKELMICFTFYMISFFFFFIGNNFFILSVAMIFFGLGEAFRSGTHKAMIYSYLEQQGWFKEKGFVYGRTRSFSLMGASISSFLSILFAIKLPVMRWIFLASIIPYFLDFLLIYSYPDTLDERKPGSVFTINYFISESVKQVKKIFVDIKLTNILISSSLYDGIFKSIKDYIQPILQITLILSFADNFTKFSSDEKLKIYLGITYGIFYIFSSIASKNMYRLNKFKSSHELMDIFFDFMGIVLIILSVFIKKGFTIPIICLFFILYVMKDSRRPLFVDVCGDYMDGDQRATVLSVDSQLRSLFMIVLAPIFGFIADKFSIELLFILIGVSVLVLNQLIKKQFKKTIME